MAPSKGYASGEEMSYVIEQRSVGDERERERERERKAMARGAWKQK